MRDSISPVSCAAANVRAARLSRRRESGVSQSEASAVTTKAKEENSNTGRATLALEIPAARMAVISLSLDMRLRPIKIPTSTPSGRANGSVDGSAYSRSLATTDAEAELFTSRADKRSMVRRNSTNTNSSVPNAAPINTSLKMALLRIRITAYFCATNAGAATLGSLPGSFSDRARSRLSNSSEGQTTAEEVASLAVSKWLKLEPLLM